jgi:predicted CXXCH cytochrome family protein
MTLVGSFLNRFSRPIKIGIQVAILGVILMAVATVGFIEYSAQPSFCTNCHLMQPYYDSWATSSHNNVKCISCHYAPGIKAEAMGKLQAANQVVKYVTGAYGTKPWAEIEDAACLRSGCHTERALEGQVNYQGIGFDHTQHLGELRRGKRLRCTSCHSQIVQGNEGVDYQGVEIGAAHLRVTAVTCYLCHFKDRPAGEPLAGCTGCHHSPPRFRSPAGFVVDHPTYVEEMVSCVSCHEDVTGGTGEAGQRRCFNCHNEPERIAEFENTTLVHRIHIAEHNVECTQCHQPILHRVVSLAETFELDCASCHQRVHEEQRQMYAGMGGHGSDDMPSSMFLARVSCQSCHGLPGEVPGHEEVKLAGEATCMSCHGIRYANILPAWQRELDRKLQQVASLVSGARSTTGAVPVRTRATVDSLLTLAEENIDFVERGKGAHNVAYADELLRASVGLVEEAVEEGPLPYSVPDLQLGPPISRNVCLQCHVEIGTQSISFAGTRFNHSYHTQRAGLPCSSCHSSLEDHGETFVTGRATCNTCHHAAAQPDNCSDCHDGPGGAPTRPVATDLGDFPHQLHRDAGLACALCHESPGMGAGELPCQGCHTLHHQPDNNCLACHRGGVKEKHMPIAHNGCTMCHQDRAEWITEWSRQVCTVCHADMVEHNAPADCALCHRDIPSLGGN